MVVVEVVVLGAVVLAVEEAVLSVEVGVLVVVTDTEGAVVVVVVEWLVRTAAAVLDVSTTDEEEAVEVTVVEVGLPALAGGSVAGMTELLAGGRGKGGSPLRGEEGEERTADEPGGGGGSA